MSTVEIGLGATAKFNPRASTTFSFLWAFFHWCSSLLCFWCSRGSCYSNKLTSRSSKGLKVFISYKTSFVADEHLRGRNGLLLPSFLLRELLRYPRERYFVFVSALASGSYKLLKLVDLLGLGIMIDLFCSIRAPGIQLIPSFMVQRLHVTMGLHWKTVRTLRKDWGNTKEQSKGMTQRMGLLYTHGRHSTR